MSKKCINVGGRDICSGPRANWWLDSIGLDWYSGGGEAEPADPEFLFWLPFETDDSAPLATPLQDFYGNLVDVTQPNGNMSIAGNQIIKTGASSSSVANFLQSQESFARVRGHMLLAKAKVSDASASVRLRFNSTNPHAIQLNSLVCTVQDRFASASINFAISENTTYILIMILRDNGCFYMLSDGVTHYLMYPSSRWSDASLPIQLALGSTSAGGSQSDCDSIILDDLTGSLVDTDWFFDTDSIDDAVNGNTFVHNTSGWIVFRVQTLPSSGDIEIKFRIQDASNYMSLRIGPVGATNGMLFEVVAGVDAQLGASFAVASASEYRLFLNGTNIILFNDATSPQLINTTGNNFTAETDGEVTSQGTGGDITYVHTMPFSITQSNFTTQLLQILGVSDPSGEPNIQTLYVSASGSGDGSEGSPMSLSAARAASGPGTTIIFKAGTYTADFSEITEFGTSDYPLTWKPAPGEVVILKSTGDFETRGNYHVINGDGGYMRLYTDAWTGDRFLTSEAFDFGIYGVGSKILNCIIHDFGNIGSWVVASNSEIKGNLILNIGRGNGSQGHPLYIQNEIGEKLIEDNLFIQTFESAFIIHQYGSGASSLKGLTYRRNIAVGGRWLAGSGGAKVEDLKIIGNAHIGPGTFEIGLLGATDQLHDGITITDNVSLDAGVNLKKGTNISILRNRFNKSAQAVHTINNVTGPIEIDSNEYNYYDSIPTNKWQFNTSNYSTLELWQGAGFDLNGEYNAYPASVPPDMVTVYPSQAATQRAGVLIENYSESANVTVDLSSVSGLVVSGTYRLYNGQNYEEYHEFVLASNKIVSVPMTGWTVAVPIGIDPETTAMPTQPNLFPKYGVFYLMPDYTTVP